MAETKKKKPVKKTAIPASAYQLGSNILENQSINMLIYGVPGVGKTPFVGTGGEKMLILDSDNGIVSAAAAKSKAFVMSGIDFSEVEDCYQFLKNEKHDFKWVWWDSLSLFQERSLIDDILVDAHAINPNQSLDVASQREYLISQTRIARYVRQFVSLPINFGITAHVSIAEDPHSDDGELIYVPAISGGGGKPGSVPLWSRVCGYMNVLGYMSVVKKKDGEKKKSVCRIQFQGDKTHIARDRFNALGKFIDNPTIPMIESLIAENKTSKKGNK